MNWNGGWLRGHVAREGVSGSSVVKGNHLFEVLEVGAWQEGFVLQASGNEGKLLNRKVTCAQPCFTQSSSLVVRGQVWDMA